MKKQIPTAIELMNKSVRTVTADMGLRDLVKFFLKHSISCAPVVEKQGQHRILLGFVSQGDALSHLSNQIFLGFPRMPLQVDHIMKKHPIAVLTETDLFAIASILNSHGYRHVPVVDAENHLHGLISRREVLKALMDYFEAQESEYEGEHFPPDLHKIMNHRFIVSKR